MSMAVVELTQKWGWPWVTRGEPLNDIGERARMELRLGGHGAEIAASMSFSGLGGRNDAG